MSCWPTSSAPCAGPPARPERPTLRPGTTRGRRPPNPSLSRGKAAEGDSGRLDILGAAGRCLARQPTLWALLRFPVEPRPEFLQVRRVQRPDLLELRPRLIPLTGAEQRHDQQDARLDTRRVEVQTVVADRAD